MDTLKGTGKTTAVRKRSLNFNPSIVQYCLWLTFFFFCLILWTRYLLGSNCLTCKMRKWSRTRWFSKNFLQPLVIHDLRESFSYFCITILSLGLPVTLYSTQTSFSEQITLNSRCLSAPALKHTLGNLTENTLGKKIFTCWKETASVSKCISGQLSPKQGSNNNNEHLLSTY